VEWFEGIITAHCRDSHLVQLVAVVDGDIVGTVSASLYEPVDSAERVDLSRRRLHVNSLGVVSAHRRGGVGSALMRAVEVWGRERHVQAVVLRKEPLPA
jgi:GNAT superfamily N-acetyltransferase